MNVAVFVGVDVSVGLDVLVEEGVRLLEELVLWWVYRQVAQYLAQHRSGLVECRKHREQKDQVNNNDDKDGVADAHQITLSSLPRKK